MMSSAGPANAVLANANDTAAAARVHGSFVMISVSFNVVW
jgi:hypothetical protein